MDPVQATDTLQAVQTDTSCTRCGYNLRGLDPQGRCPECGEAIALSLRGDLLAYADPQWLARVRSGIGLLLWNIVLAILVPFTAIPLPGMAFARTFGQILAQAVELVAAFYVTAQEPRVSLQERRTSLRRVIRSCAFVGTLGALLLFIEELTDVSAGLFAVLGAGLSLAGFVATFGQLIYFRRFARRIPHEKLARSTGRLLWAGPIVLGIHAIAVLVLTLVFERMTPPPPEPPDILMGTICSTTVFGLIFFVWYVLLLMRYRRAFATACTAARAIMCGSGRDEAQRHGPERTHHAEE
ncbi:MAG: hypothetical protein HY763_16390 [Planctomycetes bacterium]|nr:hypothetical protein [Planctomycetota bacterium]